MENLIKEYYKLIEKDREYLNKYIKEFNGTDFAIYEFKNLMENSFIWRKIKDYKTLENVINSKNAMELMRIEDYYSDEVYEVLENYLNIDFTELSETKREKILSKRNLKELLNKDDTPQRVKDCIEISLKCEKICKELIVYIMANDKKTDYTIPKIQEELEEADIEKVFGKVRKCAIFIHSSIDNKEYIARLQERLEKFCQKTLATKEYEIFLEIGSFLGERDVFENMLKRFKTEEFSHLIVVNIGQIYKLSYDMNKAIELVDRIQDMNVTIVSVDEKRVVESKKQIINNEDLDEEV